MGRDAIERDAQVEFLDYKKAAKELAELGVAERPDGDLMRFTLDAEVDSVHEPVELVIGPEAPDGDPARHVKASREALGEIVAAFVHSTRTPETLLIPAAHWRTIIDLVAYELASDEAWLEVDAEASLHQNGRDPLSLLPPDLHLLETLARALSSAITAAGEAEPAEDVYVITMGVPVIFCLSHTGVLRVQCPSAALADQLADHIG